MDFFLCLGCSFSSEHRDTEAFESVAEDEQLPQIVDELHDLFLSPGAPIAKMSVRVKGQLCFLSMDANFVSFQILLYLYSDYLCTIYSKGFLFLHLHLLYLFNSSDSNHNGINVLNPFHEHVYIPNKYSHCFASKSTVLF